MEICRSIWRFEFQSWCFVAASGRLWQSLGGSGTILSGLSVWRYFPARVPKSPDLESVWTYICVLYPVHLSPGQHLQQLHHIGSALAMTGTTGQLLTSRCTWRHEVRGWRCEERVLGSTGGKIYVHVFFLGTGGLGIRCLD